MYAPGPHDPNEIVYEISVDGDARVTFEVDLPTQEEWNILGDGDLQIGMTMDIAVDQSTIDANATIRLTVDRLDAADPQILDETIKGEDLVERLNTPTTWQHAVTWEGGGGNQSLGLGIAVLADVDPTVWIDNFVLWLAPIADLTLLGDYNQDGEVNAPDYNVWRDTFLSTEDLRADGNDNGIVDAPDYNTWRDNFGNVANASIPEPSTLVLLLPAAVTVLLRRRNS